MINITSFIALGAWQYYNLTDLFTILFHNTCESKTVSCELFSGFCDITSCQPITGFTVWSPAPSRACLGKTPIPRFSSFPESTPFPWIAAWLPLLSAKRGTLCRAAKVKMNYISSDDWPFFYNWGRRSELLTVFHGGSKCVKWPFTTVKYS